MVEFIDIHRGVVAESTLERPHDVRRNPAAVVRTRLGGRHAAPIHVAGIHSTGIKGQVIPDCAYRITDFGVASRRIT